MRRNIALDTTHASRALGRQRRLGRSACQVGGDDLAGVAKSLQRTQVGQDHLAAMVSTLVRQRIRDDEDAWREVAAALNVAAGPAGAKMPAGWAARAIGEAVAAELQQALGLLRQEGRPVAKQLRGVGVDQGCGQHGLGFVVPARRDGDQ